MKLSFRCDCGTLHELTILIDSRNDGERLPPEPAAGAADLSDFEDKVLRCIAAGHTDRETARLLGVSLHRVRYGVRNAISHLAARTRAEAVYRAFGGSQIR
jgi:DNA-binding CsgD family transcriptional regulator